eukprot:TRINITY_DN1250_c0_g1_i2.p1 TRINITY_DN1250_c0_g1~~TRINITY_DN1250_c0_g1_i2.p1  ORF type:complete len:146 (-),score=17.80 TRINITY_DN1250_c0_g1_i2:568-1005(-)
MIQPLLLPAIVTETGFSHNHTNMYVMAYACWNIKFASIHQDDGTLFHIGHSHLPALISCFLYGTDYMEYRVASLHLHFTLGMVKSYYKDNAKCVLNKDDPVGRMLGYGSFYDLFMHEDWMSLVAWAAAGATILHSLQLLSMVLSS